MRILTHIYILLLALGLISCFSTKLTVRKASEPISINHANPYTDYWSAFYCGMPEHTPKYAEYEEQVLLTQAFDYIKLGKLSNSESILRNLYHSPNDTIATAARKLLNSILFYDSKWQSCDSLQKEINQKKKKKTIPLYVDYTQLQQERYVYSDKADTLSIAIENGLPILPISINGRVLRFLIDTGCDITCLRQSVANELNLKPIASHSSGVYNSVGDFFDVVSSAIDSLKIANTVVYSHPVIVTSDNNLSFEVLNNAFMEFHGIIGWNYLKNLDFTLDFKTKKLIIRKPEHRPDAIQNMFWLGTPIIKLYSAGGLELNFAFDTGDQVSNFFDLLIQKTNPKKIETDFRRSFGVGSVRLIEVKRIPSISLYFDKYEIRISNFESGFEMPGSIICLDGRLGSDFILNAKIRIDALNNNIEYYKYDLYE